VFKGTEQNIVFLITVLLLHIVLQQGERCRCDVTRRSRIWSTN